MHLGLDRTQFRALEKVVLLYPKSHNIHDMMAGLINDYFARHLQLCAEDAKMLHQRYYKDYGLAITGLALHHKVAPLEFNKEVDDALPLDDIITPNPQLRRLLADIDRTKVKLWLFTNAYITHAQRVIRLLGIEDMFEGITYCDYGKIPITCKPYTEMYRKAEIEAGASSADDCFFVDDSYLNCYHAQERGWTTAHLVEQTESEPEVKAAQYQIKELEELRRTFPWLFKGSSTQSDVPKSVNGLGVGGANGVNGVNGVHGVNGVNGVHAIDEVDGANGEYGVKGAYGVNGEFGVDGVRVDGLDSLDGVKRWNGMNGVESSFRLQGLCGKV
ncbi:MAG: hypothetical protein Q9176_003791 [Flavoplaca citrina]